ncbi:uncharacterized protein LOC121740038 isoform X2 [Aricia agestis]|uniref:uncharacterized protein LOC121740038 isoform X2 n=1 Tax=Aricia agestis TaxID=91739 RepID=UPI001C20B7D0|nr:uncharacterized protein LOC121740038 isoform X2 [Aricia agestis]
MFKPISDVLLRHAVKITDITGLKLTCQEENLITQGLNTGFRDTDDKGTKPNARSRICILGMSGDSFKYGKDFFGYKPISNQVKKPKIICEYNKPRIDDTFRFIVDIMHEIIDKVEETSTKKLKYEIEILATPEKNLYKSVKSNLDLVEDTLKEMVDFDDFEVIDGNNFEGTRFCR